MAVLAYGAPMAKKKLRKVPVQKPRQVMPVRPASLAVPRRDSRWSANVLGMDRCKVIRGEWLVNLMGWIQGQ